MLAALQIFFVLAASGGLLYVLGSYYLVIGALVFAVSFAVFWSREHSIKASEAKWISLDDPYGEDLSHVAISFLYRLILAAILGAIWPSLPVIIGAGHARDKIDRQGP